jgi:hypothetical protein
MSGTGRSSDRARIRSQGSEPVPPAGSAAEEAALADRITGPGSGPYSGTPFPTPEAAEEERPEQVHQHEHGIIDEVRHVSSMGRR